jgi:hypothetical protein
MMLTRRPAIFFGLLAGLKVMFESWASMAIAVRLDRRRLIVQRQGRSV